MSKYQSNNEFYYYLCFSKKSSISQYVLGDMSSTVYPVGGGMEDWAYGAGWDNRDKDAAMNKCTPFTYPLESSIDLSFEA